MLTVSIGLNCFISVGKKVNLLATTAIRMSLFLAVFVAAGAECPEFLLAISVVSYKPDVLKILSDTPPDRLCRNVAWALGSSSTGQHWQLGNGTSVSWEFDTCLSR